MILQVAAFAASVVDSVSQAPFVVQCPANSSPDPLWLKFAIASLPSAFALGIAWLAFRWSNIKDHKQWLLENKKEEWQRLISLAAKIEYHMPSVTIASRLVDAVKGGELEEHLRLFTQAALECVFAASVLGEGGLYEKLVNLREAKERAMIDIGAYELSPMAAHSQGLASPVQVAQKFQADFASIFRDVHELAMKDLDISN